ncbi:amidohydrolase [Pseudoclavibacter sp. RFBB5]|uniref:amidohydrolase n=1 Tax=Pseudoclavibacter sp. RFBB5 TaxID=2080574 RepID=UPI000CE76C0D|nr:amidohydrolase [Pseudoclavibacter sp. RFBB5]PPG27568.1 amidohydrolase [Pseudoclavibacter sp. RFBB5]
MTTTLYLNGRVFQGTASADPMDAADAADPSAFVVRDGKFAFVGDEADARAFAAEPDATVDLGGQLVLPGITDAHTHLVMMGEALGQVGLTDARDLAEVQRLLAEARAADPDARVLRGRGWLFDSIPGGAPTAAMIDEVVADVPVYLDANDYHSCWVNSAALRELGITRETPDPSGGRIERDADGEPNGMLYETAAVEYAWVQRDLAMTDADRDAAVERVLAAYSEAGVTGVVDMALNEVALDALQRAADRRDGQLPLRVAAHWLVSNADDDVANLEQVERARALATKYASPWLRVVGIKLILDGTIDACTAAMSQPYSDGSNADAIWPVERLLPVVAAADAAGLQIAMHAIGDAASTMALDALEHAFVANGDIVRRHRIEHLEYAAPGTAERMAALGITASMQPVHADPAILGNWIAQLDDDRVERGFAWHEYEDAQATLAFSTDAPTAPYGPLANLYVAATRESALDPAFPAAQVLGRTVPIERAIVHATRDAAASVGDASWRGKIREGFAADFFVVDTDVLSEPAASLLTARTVLTVVGGRVTFEA